MAFSFVPTKNAKGFTLIELIIVVAIMALLTAFIAFISSVMIQRARVAKAQGEMNRLAKAIKQLEMDTGMHPGPTALTTCAHVAIDDVLLNNSERVGLVGGATMFDDWKGPYIESVPATDPWGTPYYLDADYYCNSNSKGCEDYSHGQLVRAIRSNGPNKVFDADLSTPAYDEDNVALVLCTN